MNLYSSQLLLASPLIFSGLYWLKMFISWLNMRGVHYEYFFLLVGTKWVFFMALIGEADLKCGDEKSNGLVLLAMLNAGFKTVEKV